MLDELSFFQENAVNALIRQSEMAVSEYKSFAAQQVISLTAPTGSGKTIMMAAFIERILFGSENNLENPDAVFVWLSDSPALNEQSKNKIGAKAEKVGFGRCVTIEDESFNQEFLDDGKVYFLNTQKLGKGSNLVQYKDKRDYTIWDTLNNTIEEKGDRLYFIIDEAHRGAKTSQTTIMQKFLKGDNAVGLKPMPLVIGMSATSERFEKLVEGLNSVTPRKVVVTASDVRDSGLLKDKIIIYYPEDTGIHDNMAILQAATDEWKEKCKHWFIYSKEQKDKMVNPVFVIQVEPGKGDEISNTDLNECLLKIEERSGWKFNEGEVVHTFGSTSDIEINGLKVPYIEPQDIADDRNIRIVFFKENLSTGWDCPRAETMMSFRHANDSTYIAQLLGRMIRTPLQRHINVDEYLNDVRLYLPYFNRENANKVAEALKKEECEDLPTEIGVESTSGSGAKSWGLTPRTKDPRTEITGQITLGESGDEGDAFDFDNNYLNDTREGGESETASAQNETGAVNVTAETSDNNQPEPVATVPSQSAESENPFEGKETSGEQVTIPQVGIDRHAVLKFINKLGIETYSVRPAKTSDYIDSMLKLAHVLVKYTIDPSAVADIHNDVIKMIHDYTQALRANGKYDDLSKNVLNFKLLSSVFNAFGDEQKQVTLFDVNLTSDADLARKQREAESVLGRDGIINDYVNHYYDEYDLNELIVDCILFAADQDCMDKFRAYAKKEFNNMNDENRVYTNSMGDSFKNEYNNIVRSGEAVIPLTFGIPSKIEPSNQIGGKEYDNHLFIDESTGSAVIRLNSWEDDTINEESHRSDFVCWLRNPPGAKWSLCVPYVVDNETKAMYPDFIVIRNLSNVGYVLDILEPHGPQYTDNLPKAQGLVAYANKNTCVGRVQIIREVSVGGVKKLRRLDLAKTAVKDEVLKARTVDEFNHIFDTMGVIDD